MFKEPAYRDAMARLGCCIAPLVSAQNIAALRALHTSSFSAGQGEGLVANHNSTPVEQALSVSRQIEQIVADDLRAVFHDFRYFVGHFMVKKAGTVDEFPLHQDWNIVHEAQHDCYQVWIPLQMTDSSNGGMFFVPGSHRFFNNYRSGSFNISRIPTDETIAPWMEQAIVPPGQAFVYSNALFHASSPNASEHDRISVIVNIVAKDAPTYYFHHLPELGEVAWYPMDSETLLTNLPDLEKGLMPFTIAPHHTESIPDHMNNRALSSVGLADAARAQRGQDAGHRSSLMLPIVRSVAFEQALLDDGYAVLPFLNPEDVSKAKDLFSTIERNHDEHNGLYTTLMSPDGSTRKAVGQALADLLDARLRDVLIDHRMPLSLFFAKLPNPNGAIGLHTDSSLLLNPRLEPHYGIWIPLQDVGTHNGTLMVVPGSHNWFRGVAAASVPWPYTDHMEKILPMAKALDLSAGQMVIFDNRLLHGSTVNSSERMRVCIAARVTHRCSSYYSYWRSAHHGNRVGVYAEATDIYLNEEWKGDRCDHSHASYLGDIAQPSLTHAFQTSPLS